jgi:FkbM family methyltransferase
LTSTALAADLNNLLAEDLASVRDRELCTFDRILTAYDGRCVLFGAGSLGRSVLRCLLADGIHPLAFSDSNSARWNTSIDGIPVLPPAEATARYGTDAAFFVTIWTTGHSYIDTQIKLNSLGARTVYPVASVRWKYSAELLPFLCQDLPHKVYKEADLVEAAFHLLSDDDSRHEYLRQIRYRALGDYGCLSAPDPEPSYFVDSLFALRTDEVFVDCGAFDGDTLRELLRRQRTFSRSLAFEPDPMNFRALQEFANALPPEARARCRVFPYALGAKRGHARFSANELAVSQAGEITVEVFPLDEISGDLTPTFVKMDIEGAEIEALKGSEKLISRFHPILSICLYHRQNDLWRVPLLIHSMYAGYSYFLRAHDGDGWQTVGYAVPPARLKPTPSR